MLSSLIIDFGRIQQQYKLDDIPSLFVATKSDLDLAQQVRGPLLSASGASPRD